MTSPGDDFRSRMMGKSETLFSIPEFIASGESQERLASLRQTFEMLCDFLESNVLAKGSLYSKESGIGDDFVLSKDQLTQEGFALFQESAYEWMRGQDHGKPLSDTSRLQKALVKIRKS